MKGSFPIESFRQLETPFYYYDTAVLRKTLAAIANQTRCNGNYRVHYAIKANANSKLLRIISSYGLGADCVSGGEIQAALEAGFPPESIVFAGVGKTDKEILLGLRNNIGCFNVESIPELEVIDQLAARLSTTARVAFRINPNVGAHTHANITTGLAENKFGIAMEDLDWVVALAEGLSHVRFVGLHFHIGSQILDMSDFVSLCNRINDLQGHLANRKTIVESINVGGGLGVEYRHPNRKPIPDLDNYFNVFHNHLKLQPHQTLHFELGRAVVAQCGSLVSRVTFVKQGSFKQFAILDAGFSDLIRPAFYQAYHKIENISSDEEKQTYDVVGPICESSDVFQKATELNKTHRGDFLVIRSAGAYGETMASCYNCRSLPMSHLSDEFHF
ncbi:MAG: diaminopimelate decarboxylase [Bacteroidales bacterium]|nr:diaminopimelate decarboxylase [Bacteroidales bacterium]